MAYELKEGQGSLFKNDKQNDRQPDFKGSIMIKGVLYSVSAWNRTSQNGRQYISLQAEERQADGQQPAYRQQSYQQPAYRQPQAPQPTPQAAAQPAFGQQTPPPPTEEDMPFDLGSSEDMPF